MNESRPEPLGWQTAIVGLLLVLLHASRALNLWNLDDTQYSALEDVIHAAVTVVALYVGYRWSRARVTPVEDPMAVNTVGKLVKLKPADGSELPEKVK